MPTETILFIVRGMSLKNEFRMGITSRPVTFNQDLKALVAREGILPLFLAYAIKSRTKDILGMVGEAGHGTGVLPTDRIERLEIPVPESTQQQKKIVHILKTLDDKIQLNHQTNQTMEEIAQVIFKSWFVDFEPVKAKANGQDPERSAMCAISGKTDAELDQLSPDQLAKLTATAALFPDELNDSEQGQIPNGWKWKPIDAIANYQNGLALQKYRPKDNQNFLPVVKIAQLKYGVATSEEKASPDINPACIIDNGDVVFSWSGSLMVDLWCGGKAALNQHLFKVTSEAYPKWFYYYWTRYHLAAFQQIAADKAVTMGHIKRSHLQEAWCAVPNVDLDRIEVLASLVSKQIELRLETFTLTRLRDTLLPKLLSGEISVSAAQSTIREAV